MTDSADTGIGNDIHALIGAMWILSGAFGMLYRSNDSGLGLILLFGAFGIAILHFSLTFLNKPS